MSDQPPREPIGTSEFHVWCRDMVRFVRRLKLISAPNGKVNRTTEGTYIVPDVGGGGTSTTGITYAGTFDPAKSGGYAKDVIVRVQTGTSQGIWISRKDGNTDAPVFPEPVTSGGTNSWDMFNFGVQASVDCQNGNRVIYINSSAPIT